MVQQSLNFLGSAANVLFQIFLVILFSYYMTTDGPRMVSNLREALPINLHHEFDSFHQMLVRAFGGFLRAQLLSAVIYTIVNALMMVLFGLPGVALASLLAGIAAIIPLIGGMIALIPTVIVAIFVNPDVVVPVLIVMLVFQQILYNVVMPRIQGDALGLHPLLVFASLLMGGAVGGFWGALFGIPIAGAISAVVQYFYLRARLNAPPATPEPPPESVALARDDAAQPAAGTRHA
jgi:predicted PurR-regulated permease PerM